MKLKNSLWILLCICGGCSKQQAPTIHPAPKVSVQKVQVQNVKQTIQSFGQVVASKSVQIAAQVSGILDRRFFKDGQMVKRGDLLFVIDPVLYKSSLDLAYANYEKAKAQLSLAKNTLERNKKLAQNEYVSELDFEGMQSDVKSAQADVKANYANLQTAKTNYSYCFIKAPISGQLSEHKVDVGNLIQSGATILTTLNQFDPVYIDFSLSDLQFERLPKKDQYPCEIQTQLNQTQTAVVSFVDNHIDPDTATILLKSLVPNTNKLFWPGQYVTVTMVTQEYPNALVVPKQAVFFDKGKRYVYVLNSNMTIKKTTIFPLLEQETTVIIKTGLSPCDSVITSGQIKLQDGQKVEISGAYNE
ncbi:MAG: Multidrug resistance protein MdtA [Chlamydiae bacterium]|nr:Multidrug resistance protein MdtA [Chlamydiota bacterium]